MKDLWLNRYNITRALCSAPQLHLADPSVVCCTPVQAKDPPMVTPRAPGYCRASCGTLILRQTARISIASQWVIAPIPFKLLPISPASTKVQLLLAGFHCTFPGKLKNKLVHIFKSLTPFQRRCRIHPCPHWGSQLPALPAVPMATRWSRSTARHGQTDTGTLTDTRRHSQTLAGTGRHTRTGRP